MLIRESTAIVSTHVIHVWGQIVVEFLILSGHSAHFQVGGDNSKVEGGILQNQYEKQSYILLSFLETK